MRAAVLALLLAGCATSSDPAMMTALALGCRRGDTRVEVVDERTMVGVAFCHAYLRYVLFTRPCATCEWEQTLPLNLGD